MSAPLTSVQEALFALGDHCVKCPTCKPEWHGETPVHQPCAVADSLYEQWRKARRGEVKTT